MFTGALLVMLVTVAPAFTVNVRLPLGAAAAAAVIITELGFPVIVILAPSVDY